MSNVGCACHNVMHHAWCMCDTVHSERHPHLQGFPARKPRRGQKRSAPKAAAQPAEAPGGSTRPAPTQTGAASVGLHAHELPAADASTADPGASQSKEAQHSGPGQAQVVKPSAKAAKKAAKEKAARQRCESFAPAVCHLSWCMAVSASCWLGDGAQISLP